MKGMAYGAAGMNVSDGMGRGNKPVSGTSGTSGSSSPSGPAAPKSLARRAKQRAINMAAYSFGKTAGRTVGQTRLPAMAKEARQSIAKTFRGSERLQARRASEHSSNRAGSAFRDAWNREKKP